MVLPAVTADKRQGVYTRHLVAMTAAYTHSFKTEIMPAGITRPARQAVGGVGGRCVEG